MTTIDEMDEFLNWDHAAVTTTEPPTDPSLALAGIQEAPNFSEMSLDPQLQNVNLMLENVDEDDFSFHALEHFSENNAFRNNGTITNHNGLDLFPGASTVAAPPPAVAALGAPPAAMPGTIDSLELKTPEVPCVTCTLGGYSCKKICEGRHKGFCTSCVALRVECSFGNFVPENVALGDTYLSNNAWSNTIGNQSSSIPNEDLFSQLRNSSATDLVNSANASDNDTAANAAAKAGPPPKIGARFSRESVRILKTWLSTHNRHPYPSDEEKEMLQRQTGLNKVQITNWLANARRRGKVQPPRSTSPQVGNWSSSIDIPKRRGTPALETMNPLQRWQNSPPENEPASVSAIARAVTASSSAVSSSGLASPYSFNYTDDGSSRSLCNQSSASSLGTSHSGSGSRGSAYSHGSRNSLGSFGSFGSAPFGSRNRRRRRRRAAPTQIKDVKSSLAVPLKTFQCTFCTDTFRTKHDWQRHEKSLHLSLERWVCAPDGPRTIHPETGQPSCVFCGLANPDDAHVESHNHSACQERTLEERTFYRKDHLNQHLRLVHNVKFSDWSMKMWKVATPEIRSRCGFCGIVMDTWTFRVDHLAEHFKTGYSMEDWKGDWGFEVPVLDMVENSIPPYLIHTERTSPLPYIATLASPESPRNAYELIKLEMSYYGQNFQEQYGHPPTDEEMMVEGCRIIFASELLSLQGIATQQSWFRDLIMKSEELMQKARFGPLRGAVENRLATLKINGKDNLFEACPMEAQLQEFAKTKTMLGLTAMDDELQEEACRIVGRVEEVSTHPSEAVSNWLLRLITSSTDWLAGFRQRASLPRSEDVQDRVFRSTDPRSIDSTIHNYTRLERELGDFLNSQRAKGYEPTNEDLQREARIIIYEFDDGWNQTAADNVAWLSAFRERHPIDGSPPTTDSFTSFAPTHSSKPSTSGHARQVFTQTLGDFSQSNFIQRLDSNGNQIKTGPFFLNDANCYRRLERELGRWVHATMSPNNPNSHVPTDAELQHQARWILYNEDDPWNQTAADNAEWLQRFKRDVGIRNDDGPGLPKGWSWALEQGGTGFAPPYLFPKSQLEPFDKDVQVSMREGGKPVPVDKSIGNSYLEHFKERYPPPAKVFCSRELEAALVDLTEKRVAETGCLPTDAEMKQRAGEVVTSGTSPSTDSTTAAVQNPADDPVLLETFKQWMLTKFPGAIQSDAVAQQQQQPPILPANMDLNLSDDELGNILQEMDFQMNEHGGFGGVDVGGAGAAGVPEQMEDAGGVSLLDMNFMD